MLRKECWTLKKKVREIPQRTKWGWNLKVCVDSILVVQCSLQDLSSPTRDQTRALNSPNHWKVKLLVAQLCATLCDPKDCSPPGSPVHWILQARILEWVAISFSRGSCWPRDQTWVSRIAGRAAPTGPPRNSLDRTSWSHRNMRWVIVSLLGGRDSDPPSSQKAGLSSQKAPSSGGKKCSRKTPPISTAGTIWVCLSQTQNRKVTLKNSSP